MRSSYLFFLVVLALAVVAVPACKREVPDLQVVSPPRPTPPPSLPPAPPPQPQNTPPVADAGPDQWGIRTTDSVELRGKGTDADGTIVAYHWNIRAYYSRLDQSATFDYNTPVVKLNNLPEGYYYCTFTVFDDGSYAASDVMEFFISSVDCPCFPVPCDLYGDPCDPWG
jgi:hypothetical protein